MCLEREKTAAVRLRVSLHVFKKVAKTFLFLFGFIVDSHGNNIKKSQEKNVIIRLKVYFHLKFVI